MATTWHKSFWRNICPLESSNLWPLFQSVITRKHEVPQSHILIIFIISSTCSLSSTTANIVIWKNFLLSLHIKPGNKVSDLALMGHDNFVGFFLNNTFFSFLFSFFIFYLFIFLLLFFNWQRWATILFKDLLNYFHKNHFFTSLDFYPVILASQRCYLFTISILLLIVAQLSMSEKYS